MKPHEKVLEALKNDEKEAIRSYKRARKGAKPKPSRVFKHIEGEEKHHLKELKELHD
jgi:rubrerythrin